MAFDTLRARIERLRGALPSPTSAVTLTRADLDGLLGHPDRVVPLADMTVADVAEIVGRAPSTVRGWCASGELRAYQLQGREWRITQEALREFQDRQANPPVDEDDDLSSWRNVA